MITEERLDAIIDQVENESLDLVEFYRQLTITKPIVGSFLTDQDTHLLTDDEHDYMLYLGVVLLRLLHGEGLLQSDLRDREAEVILETLRQFKGSRKKTAEKLGISARTLRYKLAKMRDAGAAVPE